LRAGDRASIATTLLGELKHRGAREIFEAIQKDPLAFRNPSDDISIVVVKRA
jgi:hypothetical protein